MYLKRISTVFVAVVLAACSSPTVPDPEPDGTVYDGGASTTGSNGDGLGGGSVYDDDRDLTGGELAEVIYFDFDSSDVRAADQDVVARHAVLLSSNPNARVRLQGHADERGSREYNIGLGERRAQAVRQLLMLQSVSASQIQTVSFGEERPESLGSSESDYAQNPRVEFRYE